MELIIADSDHDYTVALAARLQLWQPGCQIECCCSSQQLHSLIAEHKAKALPVVFLYNSSEFKELGHLAASDVWPKNWQVLAMQDFVPGQTGDRPTVAAPFYSRFEPVSHLIRLLDQLLLPDTSPKKHPQTEPEQQLSCIHLAFSLCAEGGRDFYQKRLACLLEAGRQLVYLPLMPTYEMDQVHLASQGPNLSDLLLDLLGDSLAGQDLGTYWQPHPDGYLQFRPPQRSDDLLTCGTDVLRKLLLAIRDKLSADPAARQVVFIACSGLPLASVAAVAVLCDVLDIELPQAGGFAATAAQVEAGRLLALLPAGCQVNRHQSPTADSRKGSAYA